MIKTFKYKAQVNYNTNKKSKQWIELCRGLYNTALQQRIEIYKQNKKNISYYTQAHELSPLKTEFIEYANMDTQCLEDVLNRVDKAFNNFFRRLKNKNGKSGFPRFKTINRYNSFTLRQNSWKLNGKYLKISKLGIFKLFLSRSIEGKIKQIIVKRTPTNEWFVYFVCDDTSVKLLPKTNKSIGIDVGISSFIVNSDNKIINNPKYFSQSQKKLRIQQRSLSRKEKGSNHRKKQKLLVAKTHEHITNQRKDFLHKTANYYITNYDTIYIESLNISNMVKNHNLAKNIVDSSWGMFFNMLSYKAESAGRTVVKVNPKNTSQNCSGCGTKVLKDLSVRIHACPNCGLILDRDYNAAINILKGGQPLQALTNENTQSVACVPS